ncbi:MAG TPA: SNF2-related protein, partial [Longimicrobiaceae bacterium]|nr:SNF2-related protein [Longimicrobiaceae bacterium]
MSVRVTAPRLVLVPDFSGALDFELRLEGEAISRVGMKSRRIEIPSLYAPLFEDPFAPPEEVEELLLWWLERASPAPDVSIRLEGGDQPVSIGGMEEVEARLVLALVDRAVSIERAIAGGEPCIPLGDALVYRAGKRSLARLANPAAWRLSSLAPGRELEFAPVTRSGRTFRPPGPVRLDVELFNDSGAAVPWPMPRGIVLEIDGRPVAAEESSPECAICVDERVDEGQAVAAVSLAPRDHPPCSWSALSDLPPGRALLSADRGSGRWKALTGRRIHEAAAVLARITELIDTAPLNHRSAATPRPHSLAFDRKSVSRRIPDIHTLCRDHGLPLRYDAADVIDGTLDIRAHAEPASPDDCEDQSSIDWFELKPEVSCAGFRLTEKQWLEVLDRGWFVAPRSAGGAPIVVDTPSRARLGRVLRSAGTLLQPPKIQPGPAGCDTRHEACRKLRILNWLTLARAGADLDLPAEEKAVVEALLDGSPFSPAPPPRFLDAQLRPYQEAGYRWLCFLYRSGFGAVLADDMGLGKTLQTIAFLAGIREGHAGLAASGAPHLVVVPPTLVFNWAAEIRRFYPRFHILEYTGPRRRPDRIADAGIVITTYDMVRRDSLTLQRTPFDVVVFDEAQTVKNYHSDRAAAARRLRSRFTICLTGTPVENHLGDLHAIVDLAVPGLLGDHRSFVEDIGNDPEHPRVLKAGPFLLRRTRERILPELPPRVESDIYLDLTESQKELYTRTVAEVREEVAEAYARQTRSQAAISALAALTRLRQACVSPALLLGRNGEPGPKIDHLTSSVEELRGEGNAALVFSQFTGALDVAERALRERGIPLLRLDGATPQPERRDTV